MPENLSVHNPLIMRWEFTHVLIIICTILFCLVWSFILLNPISAKEVKSSPLPFQEEELSYRVSWSKFIHAGSAQLILSPGLYKKDVPVRTGRAVARSAKWMRILGIDVLDIIETSFDLAYRYSYFFSANIMETDYKKTKSITFYYDSNKIEYIEKGVIEFFKLKGKTHDVLSALYYTRTLPLEEGGSFFIPVFDEGKDYLLEVKAVGHETLRLQDIEIDTFKTKILMKTKGIFNRKGDVYIWFSSDLRRIPVQMKCDIFLGYFHVELENAEDFFRFR